MNRQELIDTIKRKKSFLCTGLDTDINKLPNPFAPDVKNILPFNKSIINATHSLSAAYKINTAFYEQYGAQGWEIMEQTLASIPQGCFTIADAKRGDIGNTSSMYARAFFETLNFHSVTVAPYMGEDSLRPFLEFKDKWIICLALTSNSGHQDFQKLNVDGQKKLYETVLETVSKYGNINNLMFVVGATRAKDLEHIRSIVPEHFLLVPGVGAQGGDLHEVAQHGINSDCGLLVNSSRGILYASDQANYAQKAQEEAQKMQKVMAQFL
jgi:orotidine-5'-phosphate decarboxylase